MTHPHHHGHCPHRELAVGWALHALEPTGNSLITAHLPDCTTCTHTATQTEEIAALLGLSLPHATPSAQLEQRIIRATITTRKKHHPGHRHTGHNQHHTSHADCGTALKTGYDHHANPDSALVYITGARERIGPESGGSIRLQRAATYLEHASSTSTHPTKTNHPKNTLAKKEG